MYTASSIHIEPSKFHVLWNCRIFYTLRALFRRFSCYHQRQFSACRQIPELQYKSLLPELLADFLACFCACVVAGLFICSGERGGDTLPHLGRATAGLRQGNQATAGQNENENPDPDLSGNKNFLFFFY
jgi:hypothetical protein